MIHSSSVLPNIALHSNMICSAVACDGRIMPEGLDFPHERLAWARQRAGFPDKADFARAMGVNATTYRAYENGQNGFAKLAAQFAKRLGVSAEWLLEGGPPPTGPIEVADVPPAMLATADDGTVELQRLDLSLSMGPGTLIDDYVEAEPVRFDPSFVRLITRAPYHRLKLVTGIGDSMYPTLNWGDTIMIDTTDRALGKQDAIYWISVYGASGLKRLRAIGKGRVLVVSDNPSVPDQEVDAEDLRIEGRAVWFARGL
ncbi:hypothetical protein CA234_09590 [Sphingomonas sp. ABOLE]|nr:hypothetical protein CA234_09590 [Sphingomonas sp. ABOLE]